MEDLEANRKLLTDGEQYYKIDPLISIRFVCSRAELESSGNMAGISLLMNYMQ